MTDRRAEWLAERKQFVTASDVDALLGESEYKTRDQLRLEKLGLADEWAGDESTDIALEFEPTILNIARKRWGWDIEHNVNSRLYRDFDCPRLAATPDGIMPTPYGPAVVQVKWTLCAAPEDCKPTTKKGKPSKAKWLDGAPLGYLLQVQAELACTGFDHGVLLVLHHGGKNKLRPYYIPRHNGAIARIRKEAMLFWKEIEDATQ
jgi:predicted phage-related endonuclease